ncbi:MAG: phosphoribosylamine--glycine ligase [Anaerolineae bacterium]|nr:phosphoribosylamine--glycine ligase [Anaerolineae bacterium]
MGRLGVIDQKVLVVGSGGREHALAWAIARSPSAAQVYVAPGNAGTTWGAAKNRAPSTNVSISAEDIPALVAFARRENIDLAVIGPEVPLAQGIVDAFQSAGMRVFGPTRAAAQLESSKTFSKEFMRRHHIPTAAYGAFTDYVEARAFVTGFGRSVVVKADGLAAGKGVIVCATVAEADAALRSIMLEREFGAAGDRVVIEERLTGAELSALAFCDGKTAALMPLARDHKRVGDGDTGLNTGGMGAYAPVLDVPPDLVETIREQVIIPALRGMASEGTPYTGVLYAGLMLTPDGIRVLEFNCRFGDPETQVILPLLDSDLVEIMTACTEGRLREHQPRWLPGACATIVLASPGYPGTYPKGLPISGLESRHEDVIVFHAGTSREGDRVVTAGGRVLAVSARGESLPKALANAYAHIPNIRFEGMHYRRDIGRIAEGATR